MDLKRFEGKKIALLGFGIENIAVAKVFLKHKIDFIILDRVSIDQLSKEAQELIKSKKLEVRSGKNYLSHLDEFDIIVRSPGVPYLTAEIQAARLPRPGTDRQAKKAGSEITSSTKLFFELAPAKIIGVTGTKGKGTTASLISEILKTKSKISAKGRSASGGKNQKSKLKNVFLVGNIGIPAFDVIEKLKENDLVVFELSSFQLQDLEISPEIAVVVNLADDHLDYHQTLEEYRATKQNILKYQKLGDFAVINWDYPESRKLARFGKAKKFFFSSKEKIKNGAFVDNFGDVYLTFGKSKKVCSADELKLIGRHNLENAAAAAIVGKILNVPIKNIQTAIKNFDGLSHRLEFIREVDGVKFYNDSFSTNPTPTIAAIRSFSAPITVILGGSEKGADFSGLAKEIKNSNVKNVILIGIEGPRIRRALEEQKVKVNILTGGKNIEEIIEKAFKYSKAGDIILFSPACASFDMFRNYKDRGERFKTAVLNL